MAVGRWAPKRCVGSGELRRTASFAKHPKPPSSLGFPLREPCGAPLAYCILWDCRTNALPQPGISTFSTYRCPCSLRRPDFHSYPGSPPRSDCKPYPVGSNAATGKSDVRRSMPVRVIRCNASWSCEAAPGNIDNSQVLQSELKIAKDGRVSTHLCPPPAHPRHPPNDYGVFTGAENCRCHQAPSRVAAMLAPSASSTPAWLGRGRSMPSGKPGCPFKACTRGPSRAWLNR